MNKKTIYIIDPVCPKFYDLETLENEGMGASESYLLYNTIALCKNTDIKNYQFLFFQDTREEIKDYKYDTNNIKFLPLSELINNEDLDPKSIILQRDPRLLEYLYRIYPVNRVFPFYALFPVFGVLLTFMIFYEIPTLITLIGGFIVIVATYLINKEKN